MTTLVLTSDECESLLDHRQVMAALERAHAALTTGAAEQPRPAAMRPATADAADPHGPALLPMAATWLGLAVVKTLSDIPRNRERGLPAQRSTVALYDAETAECLALIDGRTLTRIRTASATGLATRLLARPGSRVLGLIGAGALALEHLRSHQCLGYDEVVVWSRSDRTAQVLAEIAPADVSVTIAETPGEVVANADVVCTLTPSVDPILTAAELRPGLHINAVGSPPRPHFRELAADVLARANLVVVDALDVALHESGNIAAGAVDAAALVELGDIVTGAHPGRRGGREVTVFNSVGIGLQDLAAAELARSRARSAGVGREFDLRG
ncbi:ornithine cyclodeaminase family protein [Nocardia jiangxiensis]|uniref:Ornithine cyclodeaminase family protein n=1 Tax=Nocardia jiangxiensis TaxID=282685 RepID=A0ABW6RRI4_9NOCA|nr:ornithine cyclodeaminase family protein [Nocardia jiangxiensis]